MTPVSASPAPSVASADTAKLAKVARQFEAIFVRQMLSSARAASFGDNLLGSSAQDTFREMRDSRFADIAADKGVTAELKFTPNSESGTVSINLGEFDATSLDGHTLVVFEELTKQSDIDGKATDVTVAEHKDINDEGQSVTVTSTGMGFAITSSALPKDACIALATRVAKNQYEQTKINSGAATTAEVTTAAATTGCSGATNTITWTVNS